MTSEQHFTDWLIAEHYRIAKEYRLLMYKELVECRKSFGHSLGLAMPVFLSTIKKDIELPKYNSYTGSLSRAEQLAIFNKTPQLNKDAICIEFIKQHISKKETVTLAEKL